MGSPDILLSEASQSASANQTKNTISLHLNNMNFSKMKRNLSSPRIGNNSATLMSEHPRRLSIQENIAKMRRSLSSLKLTTSKSSGEGWDLFGIVIDKDLLENVLINHYEDPSIKVIFFSLLLLFNCIFFRL